MSQLDWLFLMTGLIFVKVVIFPIVKWLVA